MPGKASKTFSVRLSGAAATDLTRLLAEHHVSFGALWRRQQARLAMLERQNLRLRNALRSAVGGTGRISLDQALDQLDAQAK